MSATETRAEPRPFEEITTAVTSWPGVHAGTGRRGEFAFFVGRRTIGHLHGDRAAHFGFPKQVWQELHEAGRIDYHPVFPERQGPAARRIETAEDVREVIELFRLAYEGVIERHGLPDEGPDEGDGESPPVASLDPVELEYLSSGPPERLARLATVGADGMPQVVPVGFRVNRQLGTIEVGGHSLAKTKKFRDVARSGRAAIVIDDLESIDPWRPRGVEVRGRAEAVSEPSERIRIHPEHVRSWGL